MVSNFVLGVLLVLVFMLAMLMMTAIVLCLSLGALYWWTSQVYKRNASLNKELDKFEETRYVVNNITTIFNDLAVIENTIKELFEMNVFMDDPIIMTLMEQSGNLLNKLEGFSAASKMEE
jgi:phosphoglycerate-specific signal transduction histidine kinase